MGTKPRTQASDILAWEPLGFRVKGEEGRGKERRGGDLSHVSPPMGPRLGMGAELMHPAARDLGQGGGRSTGRALEKGK